MTGERAAPLRLFVIDDHAFVRMGLRAFFAEVDTVTVVGEAADGATAIAAIDALAADDHLPDVVLMDLRMPELDGVETTAELIRGHPTLRVVALTSYSDVEKLRAALRAGAVGYVLKDAGPDDVLAAVEAAYRGLTHIDASLTRKLAEPAAALAPGAATLTAREWEVLGLVGSGRSNRDIATTLFITERTARTHVSNVLTKLGLTSRTQAALWFSEQGRVRRL